MFFIIGESMKKTLLAACLFGLSSLAYADVVEGIGVGETAAVAKKNAVDNAVKSSVGQFLLSKEDLNDDQLSNKIIDYSSVYVKDIKTLSEEQKEEQFEVKVSVDFDSNKLVEKLKEQEPQFAVKFAAPEVKDEEPKKEEVKPTEQSQEPTFEQQVENLIIKPIKSKKFIKLESLSAPVELKDQKSNGDFVLYEVPLKISIDSTYMKSIFKWFQSLEEQEGTPVALFRYDLKAEKELSEVYKTTLSEENFAKLQTELSKLTKMPLIISLEDEDELIVRRLKYSDVHNPDVSNLKENGFVLYFNNESYGSVRDKLRSGNIIPYISKSSENGLIIPTSSVEVKIYFKLHKDDIKILQKGGKVVFSVEK